MLGIDTNHLCRSVLFPVDISQKMLSIDLEPKTLTPDSLTLKLLPINLCRDALQREAAIITSLAKLDPTQNPIS